MFKELKELKEILSEVAIPFIAWGFLFILLLMLTIFPLSYIKAKHQKAVFERLTGHKVTVWECLWGAVPKINEINGKLKIDNATNKLEK